MTAELYELTDQAAGWRMPIRVTWVNSALAEVRFAEILMLKIQQRAIAEKLRAVSTNFKEGQWWIPVRSLEALPARKSDETDPERLVRWNAPEPDLAADADFITAWCKLKTTPPVLSNPKVMMGVWANLQDFMLRWLVTEGRPLNLFFGRLDAFPVRPNWKEFVIGRMFKPGDPPTWARQQYAMGETEFFRRSIPHNTEWLTAYDSESGTMHWSLEFTPNKKFHATSQTRERQRIADAQKWKTNYLGQLLKAIREPGMAERLYENLVAYSKETNLPYGIFFDGSGARNPPTGYRSIKPTAVRVQVHLVTAAAAKGHEGCALVPEDAGLHAVSDIRPPAEDVRQRNDVDGTREG